MNFFRLLGKRNLTNEHIPTHVLPSGASCRPGEGHWQRTSPFITSQPYWQFAMPHVRASIRKTRILDLALIQTPYCCTLKTELNCISEEYYQQIVHILNKKNKHMKVQIKWTVSYTVHLLNGAGRQVEKGTAVFHI